MNSRSRHRNRRKRLTSRKRIKHPDGRLRALNTLEQLEARLLLAATPLLVADIAEGPLTSNPSDLTDVNGSLFFVANDSVHGRELWKSDGTETGTNLVKDIITEDGTGSNPTNLTNVSGTLYFTVDDGVHGVELWKSDGTEIGTVLVRDIHAGNGDTASASSDPSELTAIGDRLFFSADDGENGRELWVSDGTESGTVMVTDLFPGMHYDYIDGYSPGASDPKSLVEFHGELFFSADDGTNGRELYRSDGTASGTVMVKDVFPGQESIYYGGYFYGYEINSSDPQKLTAVDGVLFFSAEGEGSGRELWKSDGTQSGTVLVKDIYEGSYSYSDNGYMAEDRPNSSDPRKLASVNGRLFFTADDGDTGRELWTSDGTTSGTVLVKDIRTGSGEQYYYDDYDHYGYRDGPYSSEADNFKGASGLLFFTANDGQHGKELWKSDGTSDGTVLVKDIRPGSDSSYIYYSSVVDGDLFFGAHGEFDNGNELWRSDGTEDGTVLSSDIFPGPAGSYPSNMTLVDGQLFFSARTESATELWTLQEASNLAGRAYVDTNGNGVFDEAETVIEGIRFFVDANDNGQLDATEAVTTTDPFGNFRFNVEPGIHTVLNQLVPGLNQTTPSGGSGLTVTVVDTDRPVTDLDFAFTVDAPQSVDLLDSFDSGVASDDDITNLDNSSLESSLQFVVDNVQTGSIVRVYADNELIGQGVADNNSVIINTGGMNRLLDGFHEITATQQLADVKLESQTSPALRVTIDTTAPAGIDSVPPSVTPFGEPFVYDPISPDESGDVLTVTLRNEPVGASVDQEGNINWTPTIDQQGPRSFEIRMNDRAGNFTSQTVEVTVLGVIPAIPEQYTLSEDEPLAVAADAGVLANDGNESTGQLVATVVAGPDHGTLQFNTDGSFTYTPNTDFSGSDQFTYQATNGADASNQAVVMLNVLETNDAPIAMDDQFEVQEDGSLTIDASEGVLVNDTDADSAQLSARIVEDPASGSLTLNDDGSFTYVPDADFSGTDTFGYVVTDGSDESGVATATITVLAIDDQPVPLADEYEVEEDGVIDIGAQSGLLANDLDADGESLRATLVDGPSNGDLTLRDDGSFSYRPNADFFGLDTFTYAASDSVTTSAPTTVTLSVMAQPDDPLAVDDEFEVDKDSLTQVLAVLENDTADPDGEQPLTIESVTQGSAGGEVRIATDGQSIEYRPPAGFDGIESFTYTIADSDALTSEATVTIEVVESLPNSLSGFVYLDVNNDGQHDSSEMGIPGAMVRLDGTDGDGNSVSMSMLTGDDGSYEFTDLPTGMYSVLQQQPAAMLDGIMSIGSVGGTIEADRFSTIILNGNQHGSGYNFGELGLRAEYITVRLLLASSIHTHQTIRSLIADGEESVGNRSLALAIRDSARDFEPDDPSAPGMGEVDAIADSYSVAEDGNLVVDAASGLLANDMIGNTNDQTVSDLTAIVSANPDNGMLSLQSDGSFSYTPTSDFSGTDSFTYRAEGGDGGFDEATVTIQVTPVNDAPSASADSFELDENSTLDIAFLSGLLRNDSDADGDTLFANLVRGPENGQLTLQPDGSFTYVPDADFHGLDFFTYQVEDGTSASQDTTVSLNVARVNAAPVAVDDVYTVPEDEALSIDEAEGVLSNDVDDDGDDLSVLLVSSTNNGSVTLLADGSFEYTPDADFSGTDSFTYKATDGQDEAAEATVSIDVTPVNDAPRATEDEYSVSRDTTLEVGLNESLLQNDTDGDGGPLPSLQISRNADVRNGTLELNDDGTFTYTPNPEFHGVDSFTYHASDGQLESNEVTVRIVVNDEPVLTDLMFEIDEDSVLNVTAENGIVSAATDADGDTLSARIESLPLHGTVQLQTDGSFLYTPNSSFNGQDTFMVIASDGLEDSDSATVTIHVEPVNDAPVASADSYDFRSGSVLTVDSSSGLLLNDSDPDGDALFVEIVNGPANGSLALGESGAFQYIPDSGFTGDDQFTYRANDGQIVSNEVVVTIMANDAPTAVFDSFDVDEDSSLMVGIGDSILKNDTDPEDDVLVAMLVAEPQHGTVDLNSDGTFRYTPDEEFNGTDRFRYAVDDGKGLSDDVAVEINVRPTNDPPVGLADDYEINEDEILAVDAVFGLLDNDIDIDSDLLSVRRQEPPASGSLTLEDDGAFTYQPDSNFSGSDSFTYRVFDGFIESTDITVNITVNPVNDRPEVIADDYTVDEDSSLDVDSVTGVLANDVDIDSDVLTAELVSGPTDGTLTFSDDGSFVYVPDNGFFGNDSFTYRANDGTASSVEQSVTITVTESEFAQDLVAFAQALADAGVVMYGAAWCPHCTQQKQLFEAGKVFVPFVEVTGPDRTPNQIAIDNDISSFPTWVFPDGTRLVGTQSLETLSATSGIAIPTSNQPFILPIDDVVLFGGSPLHIPLNGYDPNGGQLTYTVTSDDSVVATSFTSGNRSMRISVAGYGDMVFELFDGRAPRVTGQIGGLAEMGFYDGIRFHRVIDNFVIQGGDPTGTGSGGSPLGDFDDQFHVDLQHNRTGVLSMAKSTDDTNDSQFFITEGPQRFLDFNHSVFGQLVEGFDVLQAITSTATDAGDRPMFDIIMESVSTFIDNENGLLVLKAPEGAAGQANVTVTVQDEDGHSSQTSFRVTVQPDSWNGGPFLSDIGPIQTEINTPASFQLIANDVEGDAVTFDAVKMGSVDYSFEVDSVSGIVTVTPPADFAGTLEILVRVRPESSSNTNDQFDAQLVEITVGAM